MTIYRLPKEPVFPDPCEAEPDGLLAVGGDLSPERLITAYAMGIFPWYSDDEPIMWWSPNPRCVLNLDELHVPKRLGRLIRSGKYKITVDRAFAEVMEHCADAERPEQDGTWIVDDMLDAYVHLHRLGIAHSVEAWLDGYLVGGLYGVALGSLFYGESMFYLEPDASKVAFVTFAQALKKHGFTHVDCQQTTDHLVRFGAREVPRTEFLKIVDKAVKNEHLAGLWDWEFS